MAISTLYSQTRPFLTTYGQLQHAESHYIQLRVTCNVWSCLEYYVLCPKASFSLGQQNHSYISLQMYLHFLRKRPGRNVRYGSHSARANTFISHLHTDIMIRTEGYKSSVTYSSGELDVGRYSVVYGVAGMRALPPSGPRRRPRVDMRNGVLSGGVFLRQGCTHSAVIRCPSGSAERVLVAEHERRQSSSGRNLAEDLASRLFDHRMAVATSFKPTNVWTDSPTVNNLKRDDLPLLR